MSIFMNSEKAVPPGLEIMVGKTVEAATKVAADMDFVVRLVEVDGEPYSLESTFREGRINFSVKDGIVVSVGVG